MNIFLCVISFGDNLYSFKPVRAPATVVDHNVNMCKSVRH